MKSSLSPFHGSGNSDDDANESLRYHRPKPTLNSQMHSLWQGRGRRLLQPPLLQLPPPLGFFSVLELFAFVYKFSQQTQQFEAQGGGVCGLAILGEKYVLQHGHIRPAENTRVRQQYGYFSFTQQPDLWQVLQTILGTIGPKFGSAEDSRAFGVNMSLITFHLNAHKSAKPRCSRTLFAGLRAGSTCCLWPSESASNSGNATAGDSRASNCSCTSTILARRTWSSDQVAMSSTDCIL